MKLSVFDLLTARFWAQDLNLRQLWDDAKTDSPILEDYEIDPYYLLQIVALLEPGVDKAGQSRAPSIKRSAVLQMNVEQPRKGWGRAVQGLCDILGMLRDDCGVLAPWLIPYNTILIPMAAVWASQAHAKGADEGANRLKLIQWFWCSVFGQRYENAPNSQAERDFHELLTWMGGGPTPESVNEFSTNGLRLREVRPKQRAIYRGVMSLILQNGALDFHKRGKITSQLVFDKKNPVDDHHVFPRAYPNGCGVAPKLRDCILNRTYIDRKTNQRLSKTAASAVELYDRSPLFRLSIEAARRESATFAVPHHSYNDVQDMHDPFVRQLTDLCRLHNTRAKWVFTPSHSVGRTVGERLALTGTNWLNLRFVTPLDIALRMGAPFLVERGIDPSEEGLGPALIMRLLLAMPQKGGYFRPLADHPTLAQALWTTIRELRMAGVKSDMLAADGFESTAKHAELRALLRAYEQFLVANKRGDMATVYEEALQHLDWCPISDADCWTELPDVIWNPLQRRLLDALPGERIAPLALAMPGVTIPRRLTLSGLTASAKASAVKKPEPSGEPKAGPSDASHAHPRIAPDVAQHPLAFLMNAREVPAASRAAAKSMQLFAAGGREAEIDEVFRRILANGASLDQVEIVCASDEHVSLAWEKALRHNWPVTLGPGISAAATRPGRALVGLCDWIETDFSAAHLRHLLQSGDMGLEKEDEGFTAGDAARTLARAEAGWGRATYALSLGALRKGYETRAADPDLPDDDREVARTKATTTERVQTWITGLIASIPEPDTKGKVALQDVVDVALHYIEHTTSRSSQLDHRAAAALLDHVRELKALDTFRCSLPTALRFIRERVHSLSVAPERARPGHLYICNIAQAARSGRPHVFIVGLEEGRVFPSATEDAVLLDGEREAISPDLRRSADKIDEAVYAMLSRLAAYGAGTHVTFSYSVRDTREFRETYASWLMLQAFRLQQGQPTATYQEMKKALGEPVSSIPVSRDHATSPRAWWLRSVVGSADAGADAVTTAFPAVGKGREAEAARKSSDFTRYDGAVPEAGKALDPCAAAAYSVTELEGAASCPFRLFLKRGLGLRPVEERDRDRDVWLDPLTRGSELHDIYAAALRRCRAAKRRPSIKHDRAWLRGFAEERLQALREEMPPATDEIFARESQAFLEDVELFLHGECEDATAEPVGFEVSFGRPTDGEVEDLARPDPVEISLGHGLVFRIVGRIDRIDKVGDGAFQILDYKTGSYYHPEWTGTFKGGRRLQHALYGLAAVELLRAKHKNPKVVGGVYYFSSRKGRARRVIIAAPSKGTLATVLADLRELIVNGAFVHAPDQGNCKFCDYQAACGPAVHEQAEAKLRDPQLTAYTRLTQHD